MLFGETAAVYFENHTEHINTSCGKDADFFNVKGDGTHTYRCVLKGFKEELEGKSGGLGYRALTYQNFLLVGTCRPSGTYLKQRKRYFRVTRNTFKSTRYKHIPAIFWWVTVRAAVISRLYRVGLKLTAERLERIWKEAV
jgi:hypothetical protein